MMHLQSQTAVNKIAFEDEGDLQMPNVEVPHLLNNNNAPVYQLQCVQDAPISINYTHVLMLNKWPFHGCIRMVLMGKKHHKIHP